MRDEDCIMAAEMVFHLLLFIIQLLGVVSAIFVCCDAFCQVCLVVNMLDFY